jgi:hypothetical protein
MVSKSHILLVAVGCALFFLPGCGQTTDEKYADEIYHGTFLLQHKDSGFLHYANSKGDTLREEPRQVAFILMCYHYVGRESPTLNPGLDIMGKEFGKPAVVAKYNNYLRVQIAKLWVIYKQDDKAKDAISGITAEKTNGITKAELLNVLGDLDRHENKPADAKAKYEEALRILRDSSITMDQEHKDMLADELEGKLPKKNTP